VVDLTDWIEMSSAGGAGRGEGGRGGWVPRGAWRMIGRGGCGRVSVDD